MIFQSMAKASDAPGFWNKQYRDLFCPHKKECGVFLTGHANLFFGNLKVVESPKASHGFV